MPANQAGRTRGIIGGILVVLVIGGLLLLAAPLSIKAKETEQKCRFRLRRLGIAVNTWVIDHGQVAFPPIRNPAAGTAWRPDRKESADAVLWEYLQGDIPRPRKEGESQEEHVMRLRDAALTVCPYTDLPFWYNESLRGMRPADIAQGATAAQWYFRSQRRSDGSWPVTKGEQVGVWAVRSESVHVTIAPSEVEELRSRIGIEAADDPNKPGLAELRRQLHRYEAAQEQAKAQDPGSDGTFTMSSLREQVYFEGSPQ